MPKDNSGGRKEEEVKLREAIILYILVFAFLLLSSRFKEQLPQSKIEVSNRHESLNISLFQQSRFLSCVMATTSFHIPRNFESLIVPINVVTTLKTFTLSSLRFGSDILRHNMFL